MTISKLRRCVAGLTIIAGLLPAWTSFAADPLAPDASALLQYIAPPETETPALHVGSFDIHPGITAGGTYDNNITLGSGANKHADEIWTIAPDMAVVDNNMEDGYGTSLNLDYSPSFVFFTHNTAYNSIDQSARLAAQWVMAKLSLGLTQTYQEEEGGVVEIGQRLRQTSYNTQLSSKYNLSDKMSVELDPRLSISETAGNLGDTEWGVDAFLNRLVTSKITVSVGGSGGYITVQDSPAQEYERALVRANYTVTEKVDLDATAGGEWRELSGQSTRSSPVFGFGGAYKPVDGTTITMEAYRRSEISSLITNQNYTATGVDAAVQQRFLDRFTAGLKASYENRQYYESAVNAGSSTPATRNDNFYLVHVDIGVAIRKNWTADVFYQYEDNISNDPTHKFRDGQVGFQTSWRL